MRLDIFTRGSVGHFIFCGAADVSILKLQFSFVLIIPIIAFILVYAFRAKVEFGHLKNSVLSEFSYMDESGREYYCLDSTKVTIIIWFHPECERCLYQLTIMNSNIGHLQDVCLFFLTDEHSFFQKKYRNIWPGLLESSYVRFGITDKSELVEKFGRLVSPTLLLFNQKGILTEKLYGEVKIEKIITLIDKTYVPEQKRSGINDAHNRGADEVD
jgi:hypothetical protein